MTVEIIKKRVTIAFVIFLSFLIQKSVFSETIVERIVAIVNDEVILLSELETILSPLERQYEATYQGEELDKKLGEAKEEILNRLIETRLLLQEARSRSIEVSPQEVSDMLENVKKTFESEEKFKKALEEEGLSAAGFSKRLEDQLRIRRLVDQEVRLKINIPVDEMGRYYEENKGKFFHPTEYRLKNILIKDTGAESEKKINEILAKIKGGEDFSVLARRYSEDPGAPAGGDLGFLEKDKLIPEIREVIETLKAGEVSGIFKTRLGYQIVKVDAIKEAEEKSFDEAREEIRQSLFQEKFTKAYQEWMADLKKNSYIHIKK